MSAQRQFRRAVAVQAAGAAYPLRATLARGGAGAPAGSDVAVLSAGGVARAPSAAGNAPQAAPAVLAENLPCRLTFYGQEAGQARASFPVSAFSGADADPAAGDRVRVGLAPGEDADGPGVPGALAGGGLMAFRVVSDLVGGTRPVGVERVVVLAWDPAGDVVGGA